MKVAHRMMEVFRSWTLIGLSLSSVVFLPFSAQAAISCSFNGKTVRIEHTRNRLAAGYVDESGGGLGPVKVTLNRETGIYRYAFRVDRCVEQACAFAYGENSFAGGMFGLGLPVCINYRTITEIYFDPRSPESSRAVITSGRFNRSLGVIRTDREMGAPEESVANCQWEP